MMVLVELHIRVTFVKARLITMKVQLELCIKTGFNTTLQRKGF